MSSFVNLKKLDIKRIGLDHIRQPMWQITIQSLPMLEELHLKYGSYIEDVCKVLNKQQQFKTLIIDVSDEYNDRIDEPIEETLDYVVTTIAKKTSFRFKQHDGATSWTVTLSSRPWFKFLKWQLKNDRKETTKLN